MKNEKDTFGHKFLVYTLLAVTIICATLAILILLRTYAIMIGTGEIWIPNRLEVTRIMLKYGFAEALPYASTGLLSLWFYRKLK